uniref:Uncharacterized protein n=1 Tax=Meloidogyne javanica TaxID=6303 RepID=A0A915MR86_MELJA
MYSLSQIVASPLLGFWSTRIEKLKPPLMICNFLMFLGNFLYCLVELFPMSMSRYVMLASRFTAGIGWESYVGVLKRKSDKENLNLPKLPPYDRLAVAACYAIRFTQFFIFTNIETIGTEFAMMMFMWSPTDVVFWEAIAHSIRGLLALSTYICYIVFNLGENFPNINVTMNTLFSRIIGPRMQGTQQGILEMFGGMGRMTGPLVIGSGAENFLHAISGK